MPAPPELLTPTSPAEAVAAFGDGAGVTVMGGGTILLPELTYGRLRPARVLMLGRAGLSGVDNSNGVVRIGAATPVADLADAPEPLATAARHVADREIRAVGTIGGNLCATAGQSAPRGDLQAPLLALGARVTSVGAGRRDDRGRRGVPRVRRAGGSCSRSTCRAGQPSGYARLDRPHTHHYTMLAVSRRHGRRTACASRPPASATARGACPASSRPSPAARRRPTPPRTRPRGWSCRPTRSRRPGTESKCCRCSSQRALGQLG